MIPNNPDLITVQVYYSCRGVQTDFEDSDILHPIDYRKCIKCGKNDVLSPGKCVFRLRNTAQDENNNMVLVEQKRREAQHAYIDNNRSLYSSNSTQLFRLPTNEKDKSQANDFGGATIITIRELQKMKQRQDIGRDLDDYSLKQKELLSPK